MKSIKAFAAVLIAGVGLLGATQAGAVPTFSSGDYACDATNASDCDNLLFSLKIESAGTAGEYYIGFSILVSSSFTKTTSLLAAVAVKEFGTNVSNVSLIDAPTGSWATNGQELSPNGCNGGSVAGEICTYWTGSGNGAGPMTVGSTFTFIWKFTADSVANDGHIKFLCEKSSGDIFTGPTKACGMGSFTQGDGGLPEPNTLALLGLGLLGLGFGARHRLM